MTDDERDAVIRECIEALPEYCGEPIGSPLARRDAINDCCSALEALLPKPDPAKALRDEFRNRPCGIAPPGLDGEDGCFARWLIATGKIKEVE